MLRFCQNFTNTKDKFNEALSVKEIEGAEKKTLDGYSKGMILGETTRSKMKTLCVFSEGKGLMNLKTKIVRSDRDDFVCPILLPFDHQLVARFIFERHIITW
ncbi:hypothetical protein CEXT_401821 [Caerostris extrusa]|uniref:Uncharacterized protein n=1 Tax=Caerostris extrusa TaxID=172846 RepID=A0AAV4T941_CAEEX|nr:hypothetical protein CEXT_401821 [Caerostris extrusa]